jgi:hypothetical protein
MQLLHLRILRLGFFQNEDVYTDAFGMGHSRTGLPVERPFCFGKRLTRRMGSWGNIGRR